MILLDFKNWGDAEVFKHKDPRVSVWSLHYLENGISVAVSLVSQA